MFTLLKFSAYQNGLEPVEPSSQNNQYLDTQMAQVCRRISLVMSLSVVAYGVVMMHFQRKQTPTGDDAKAPMKRAHWSKSQWLLYGWLAIAGAALVVPYWIAAVGSLLNLRLS